MLRSGATTLEEHQIPVAQSRVTERLYNITLEHRSGSWDQHVTKGNEYFDTNIADHEIELAYPDQGDANTHVNNSDTEPETSSEESDEESANDEHEDNMHEGTSSRHVR
ncbi:hypothetical protein F511_06151 [Dorcoceras hygrometricum]|uniref:Uncharacterized protein n=1 Tax=Dorcoceras hygrometricum TaxID=472368 RepID=A0A2Z7CQB1_9LAMI|nr:hypothetical protein F511_06151 [Dorcoceras hygrometricum]